MRSLNWAILGTGSIAHRFAKGLPESASGSLVAVGSRSLEKAQAFAAEHGGDACGSYADAVEKADAVYIALPHHLHEEWTIHCARAGKGILCEKPFTLDYESAERALAEVEKAGVFFMEAFMYRCHPQTQLAHRLVQEGAIGRVFHVQADFGFAAGRDWQNFRTVNALGGGGLMDVGCYGVSLALGVLDEEPEEATYIADYTASRYDAFGAGLLRFSGNRSAAIRCAVHCQLPNEATFFGELGSIHLEQPWFGEGALTLKRGADEERRLRPHAKDLYALEADEVALRWDEKQSPHMPWELTRRVMRTLDRMRASAGFVFDPIPEELR